jgi:hypothetical protein
MWKSGIRVDFGLERRSTPYVGDFFKRSLSELE